MWVFGHILLSQISSPKEVPHFLSKVDFFNWALNSMCSCSRDSAPTLISSLSIDLWLYFTFTLISHMPLTLSNVCKFLILKTYFLYPHSSLGYYFISCIPIVCIPFLHFALHSFVFYSQFLETRLSSLSNLIAMFLFLADIFKFT